MPANWLDVPEEQGHGVEGWRFVDDVEQVAGESPGHVQCQDDLDTKVDSLLFSTFCM